MTLINLVIAMADKRIANYDSSNWLWFNGFGGYF